MALSSRLPVRLVVVIFALVGLYNFLETTVLLLGGFSSHEHYDVSLKSYTSTATMDNLFMSEHECQVTFPGLMKEIDESVKRGSFGLERQKDGYSGLLQARITDGKVSCCPLEQNKKPVS